MMPNPFTPPPEGAPNDGSATDFEDKTEKNQRQVQALKGESSTGVRYCDGCDKQLWSPRDKETGACGGCRDAGKIAELRDENARLRALLGLNT